MSTVPSDEELKNDVKALYLQAAINCWHKKHKTHSLIPDMKPFLLSFQAKYKFHFTPELTEFNKYMAENLPGFTSDCSFVNVYQSLESTNVSGGKHKKRSSSKKRTVKKRSSSKKRTIKK